MKKKAKDFDTIIKDILENKEIKSLKDIKHHDNNRLKHSLRVSYYSYNIAKKLHFNYESIARAGLLHDFYFEEINKMDNFKDKFKMFRKDHTRIALENSKKHFELNNLEENIIKSHMFPCNLTIPRYKESWLVSFVDKFISTYEFTSLFYTRFTHAINIFRKK